MSTFSLLFPCTSCRKYHMLKQRQSYNVPYIPGKKDTVVLLTAVVIRLILIRAQLSLIANCLRLKTRFCNDEIITHFTIKNAFSRTYVLCALVFTILSYAVPYSRGTGTSYIPRLCSYVELEPH